MKKKNDIFSWMIILAVLALLNSCKYSNNNNDMEEITAELFGEKVLVTTDIYIGTRTAFHESDGYINLIWQNGDELTLFCNNKKYSYKASIQTDGRTVVFSSQNGIRLQNEEGATVYALVDNHNVEVYYKDNHFVTYSDYGNVYVSKSNNARDMFLYSVGTIHDGKLELDFKHMFAYLKVSVKKEDMADKDYICVQSYTSTIIPTSFDFDIKNGKFTDETLNKGGIRAFVSKKNMEVNGNFYTTYIPVFPSDGTVSYYVFSFNESYPYLEDALFFVDDPEEGLSVGNTLVVHPVNSYTTSRNKSADGTYQVLERATEGLGIKIAFMGKGFTDQDISSGKYNRVMTREMERFFSVEPFKSLRKYFTSYCVYRVSDNNNLTYVANDHDNNEADKEWKESLTYASKCASKTDTVVRAVLVYNGNYVNRSYTLMDTSGDFVSLIMNNDPYLVCHEAGGHGFTFLGDEYVEEGFTEPTDDDKQDIKDLHKIGLFANIDIDSKHPVWEKFINNTDYASENIGAYEGADRFPKYVYRPTENSIMNDHYVCYTFNAPCREAIYKMVMKHAGKTYSEDEFYKYDKINLISNANARTRGSQNTPGKIHVIGRSPRIMKSK